MERKQSYQPKELQSCEPDLPTGVRLALNDSKIDYTEQAAGFIVSSLTTKLDQAHYILNLPWEKIRCEEAYAVLQRRKDPAKFNAGEDVEVFKETTKIASSYQNDNLPKREIENLFKNAVRYLADGNKPRPKPIKVDPTKLCMTLPEGKGRQIASIASKANGK